MRLILFTLALIISVTSCQNEDVLENTQATQDHLISENIFHHIINNIHNSFNIDNTKDCLKKLNYNLDDSDFDTTIIDFGTGSISCMNNNIESGKIIIIYDDNYNNTGSVITSTFDNYYFNDYLIQGFITIKNKGLNENENVVFDIEVDEFTINTSEGLINWNTDIKKEWINGNLTSELSDDIFRITGEANGIARNNNSFTIEIEDPLKIVLECLPLCIIKEGLVKISPNGYNERIINYGDTICDCKYDLSIGENTLPIYLY